MSKSEIPMPLGYLSEGERYLAEADMAASINATYVSPAVAEITRLNKESPLVGKRLAHISEERLKLSNLRETLIADYKSEAVLKDKNASINLSLGYLLAMFDRDRRATRICEGQDMNNYFATMRITQGVFLTDVDEEIDGVHLLDFSEGSGVIDRHGIEKTYNYLVNHGSKIDTPAGGQVGAAVMAFAEKPVVRKNKLEQEAYSRFAVFSVKLREAAATMSDIIIEGEGSEVDNVRQSILEDLEDPLKKGLITIILAKNQNYKELYRRIQASYHRTGEDFFLEYGDVLQDLLDFAYEFADQFKVAFKPELEGSEEETILGIKGQVNKLRSITRQADFSSGATEDALSHGFPLSVSFHGDPRNANRVVVNTLWQASQNNQKKVQIYYDLKKLSMDWSIADNPKFFPDLRKTMLLLTQISLDGFIEEAVRLKGVKVDAPAPINPAKKQIQLEMDHEVRINPNKRKNGAAVDAQAAFDFFTAESLPVESEDQVAVKRTIIMPTDEIFLKLTKKFTPEQRETIRKGITDWNDDGAGTFKAYHWNDRNGNRVYALRVNTTIPGGVRILVNEVRTSKGEQEFEIRLIPKREKLNKKNGNLI